jgi:MFS family permease
MKGRNPFGNRSFSFLFSSSILSSLSNALLDVSLGWLVLELTDSPLSLGLFWAVRSSPNLLFGMLAGAVADRMDRKKLLIACLFWYSIGGAFLGYLVLQEWIVLWHVLALTFVRGSIRAFEGPARQALVVDLVGSDGAMRGISLSAVGVRGMGILGGAVAGILIDATGSALPFFVLSGVYSLAVVALSFVRGVAVSETAGRQTVWKNLAEGVRIVVGNRVVLALMIMAATCEMFGFSHAVLVPVFARDVLQVGAVGLGMLNAAGSAGGLIAGLGLAILGNYRHKGRLMLGIFLAFGVSLVLFANSPAYLLSLGLIGIIGATAGGHDAMQHTLLQLSVEKHQRGRAMGIWQLSIGFGLVGSMVLGAIAEAIGAPMAQTIFGGLMILAFFLIVSAVPKLRNL